MKSAIIVDMDGTLADVSSVKYHVDLNDPKNSGRKDFALFHAASINVPTNEWVAELVRACYAAGIEVWIVTARKFKWSYHTAIWLHKNNIPYDYLQMRSDTDVSSDVYVKKEILDYIKRKSIVLFAIDDNPHILKLWQENNVPTIEVPGWTSNSKPGTTFVNGKEVPPTTTTAPSSTTMETSKSVSLAKPGKELVVASNEYLG